MLNESQQVIMNNNLEKLYPYPFQRFNQLLDGVTSETNLSQIAWSMGEPKHAAPDFLVNALTDTALIREGFGTYPPTKGTPALRTAIANFINRRFGLEPALDPDLNVLPVTGTREALFAFAQAVIEPQSDSVTVMPNPFYQIYEGAALLAGSKPYYVNCEPGNGYLPDFDGVPEEVWQRCQLLYLCSPGNPTGAVMGIAQIQTLIALSDKYNFIIASDECYSEIYMDEENPPAGLLEAASLLGRDDYKNCVAFNSLSKRSNLPGLRSGYVAGDAEIMQKFLLYRTYHGSAMSMHHQVLSTLAWNDEQHVIENRQVYRDKFALVADILNPVWPMAIPEAGFYFWPETPISDPDFAIRLVQLANVKVLPGSYLSRATDSGNPGTNRVRIALVATQSECVKAAERIVDCWHKI
jgi:N-succinyldiaminopimelate aminotransferase